VAWRLGGLYTCTVANDKPSENSTSFTIQIASAPTNVMAVQEGPTSIRVSWGSPCPLGDNTATGYRIYSSGSISEYVTVQNRLLADYSYLLTGLQNGGNYTIKLVATSQHFFSSPVVQEVTLNPGQPNVTMDSLTSTSISLSWSVSNESVVTSYEVVWQAVASSGGTYEADGKERAGLVVVSVTPAIL
jgi:hypothetical protein